MPADRPTGAERPAEVARLLDSFRERRARIGIIGLGYVGLPLALTAAKAGFTVLGFDINASYVERLNRGESYIKHIRSEPVAEAVKDGRLEATGDFTRLDEPDALLICVPTPLTKHREPDLSYVENTARAIAGRLRRGQLVARKSPTYRGTPDEVLKPLFEATGLTSGRDF